MKPFSYKKGSGLVEVIIVSSIVVLVISALIGSVTVYLKQSGKNINDVKSGYLLEEGIEAVKIMRNDSWTNNIANLNNGSTYYLYFSTDSWTATTTSSLVDSRFVKTLTLSPVYRDANDDIASSGTLDSGTKKVTVNVAWFDAASSATTSKSVSTYISNIYNN